VTFEAVEPSDRIVLQSVGTQYIVAGRTAEFEPTVSPDATYSLSVTDVRTGLSAYAVGHSVRLSAVEPGEYGFKLTASTDGQYSNTETVRVVVKPVLAFLNTPRDGIIGGI